MRSISCRYCLLLKRLPRNAMLHRTLAYQMLKVMAEQFALWTFQRRLEWLPQWHLGRLHHGTYHVIQSESSQCLMDQSIINLQIGRKTASLNFMRMNCTFVPPLPATTYIACCILHLNFKLHDATQSTTQIGHTDWMQCDCLRS